MQTCSFEDPPDRHLVVVIESRTIGASGRYASNWNAFLSSVCVRITARKRSLQRLCFYTCLSVILFTGGGGSPGPQPMEGGGLLGGSPGPHPGGDWGSGQRGLHTWGVSRPRLGGWIPACTEADTPLPADGYCCGHYASYWNAFLLQIVIKF